MTTGLRIFLSMNVINLSTYKNGATEELLTHLLTISSDELLKFSVNLYNCSGSVRSIASPYVEIHLKLRILSLSPERHTLSIDIAKTTIMFAKSCRTRASPPRSATLSSN